MHSLADFEDAARRQIPAGIYEWLAGGAADEITLRWNRQSFDRIGLRPRSLVDVARVSTRIRLFGDEMAYPILLAPTALQRLCHEEGEIATARGAGEAGAAFVLSHYTTTPVEQVAQAATSPLWFQLYIQQDKGRTKDLVQLVESAGCRALCLTVDLPTSGPRNRAQRAGFEIPCDMDVPYLVGPQLQAAPTTWGDVDWLLSNAKRPVVLKGILSADDAELALRRGVSGIVVSNHGGRDLDTALATIDALQEIAERVAGRVPVLMDGGVRRGTDVLKAIALGANAVLIGRPYCYGLGVAGAVGVRRVLQILQEEFKAAMMLMGLPRIEDIDRRALWVPNPHPS